MDDERKRAHKQDPKDLRNEKFERLHEADIERLRKDIDDIDLKILSLLRQRMNIAEQLAAKKMPGSSVFRPEREAQLLARLYARSGGEFSPVIQAVWRAIISASIARQKPDFTIGTCPKSEQRAWLFATNQLDVRRAPSLDALCAELESKKIDIAIVAPDDLAAIYPRLGLEKPIMIIATLPVLFRENYDMPSAFVLGYERPEVSDHDLYVVYHQSEKKCELTATPPADLKPDQSVLGIGTVIG